MQKKHNGLITSSTTFITISLSLFLRISLVIILALYLAILVITQTSVKDKLSSTIITSISELIPKETLLSVLAEEITPLRGTTNSLT
jgi:stage II sporulation protein P